MLGVSPDPPGKLRKFADKHDLDFTLLSDPDHATAKAYGVWVEKSMYGKKYWGNERTTFLIGPDGVITDVLRKVKPATHDELVLAALRDPADDELFHRVLEEHQPLGERHPNLRGWIDRVDGHPRAL